MRTLLFLLLLAAPPLANVATGKTSFSFAGSAVELIDSAEAAALNGTSDSYTKALTPFDLSIRLNKPDAVEADYLQRAAAAVHNWSAGEATDLERAFKAVESFVVGQKLKLRLPRVIQVIKTDGSEEFEAEGYTRGSRIILKTGSEPPSAHLVAHELFHVVSRANPALRDRVYAVFGFKPCDPIELGDATRGHTITNPDCPVVEHYITLRGPGGLGQYALVLYSRQPFKPNAGLQDYAVVGLVELTGTGKRKEPQKKEGKPVILEEFYELDFLEKVGPNTRYILHPEEISAEHFAMLVMEETVREPKYLEGVKQALRNP